MINIPAMRIFYYPPVKKGERAVVFTHPIGIGKVGWRTPEGVTKIVRRQKDPTWRVPVSVRKEHHENGEELEPVIGPGPDNPLGKYAFYLQWPSYLIHGTNKPAGVGLRSSHGCIRLYPEDIEQFFNMVPLGTQVRVVNQPFLFGWGEGQLYHAALRCPRGRYARLEQGAEEAPHPVASPRDCSSSCSSTTSRLTGIWCRACRAARVASRCPLHSPMRASSRFSPPHRACRTSLREGSTWNGKTDLPMDEATFKQMVSEIEPDSGAPAPSSAPAPSPANATKAPVHSAPKTGS